MVRNVFHSYEVLRNVMGEPTLKLPSVETPRTGDAIKALGHQWISHT